MHNPFVSIIVPVFNGEKFISRCLDSVFCQDYDNYEVIVVDDGSVDDTLKELKAFEKNTRIRVFSKENEGPASARNYGLKLCSPQSRYVFFIDSDDTVERDYLSSMLRFAGKERLIICNFNRIYQVGDAGATETPDFEKKFFTLDNFWHDENFLKLLPHGLINLSTNKCYSLDIIKNHNLLFPKKLPEDTQFNIAYLKVCKEVVYLDKKLYNYIYRPDSITSAPDVTIYEEYIKIQEELYSLIPEYLHSYVDEMVYPQYLSVTKRFLRQNNRTEPIKYLRNKYVKKSIRTHKATCKGDWLVKQLFRFRLFNILMKL